MASSSTSAVRSYVAFLSFSGKDTRQGFTSHLYDALLTEGVETFIDEDLVKGDRIDKIFEVIKEARIHIVVYSKSYASSKWCLSELAEIMKSYKCMTGECHILPIFYKVNPSDVRCKNSITHDHLQKHELELGKNSLTVAIWKAALINLAEIAGWHFENGAESKLVKDVVRRVLSLLQRRLGSMVNRNCFFSFFQEIGNHVTADLKNAFNHNTSQGQKGEELKNRPFTPTEVQKISANKKVIGEGGSGKVSLGSLPYGTTVEELKKAINGVESAKERQLQATPVQDIVCRVSSILEGHDQTCPQDLQPQHYSRCSPRPQLIDSPRQQFPLFEPRQWSNSVPCCYDSLEENRPVSYEDCNLRLQHRALTTNFGVDRLNLSENRYLDGDREHPWSGNCSCYSGNFPFEDCNHNLFLKCEALNRNYQVVKGFNPPKECYCKRDWFCRRGSLHSENSSAIRHTSSEDYLRLKLQAFPKNEEVDGLNPSEGRCINGGSRGFSRPDKDCSLKSTLSDKLDSPEVGCFNFDQKYPRRGRGSCQSENSPATRHSSYIVYNLKLKQRAMARNYQARGLGRSDDQYSLGDQVYPQNGKIPSLSGDSPATRSIAFEDDGSNLRLKGKAVDKDYLVDGPNVHEDRPDQIYLQPSHSNSVGDRNTSRRDFNLEITRQQLSVKNYEFDSNSSFHTGSLTAIRPPYKECNLKLKSMGMALDQNHEVDSYNLPKNRHFNDDSVNPQRSRVFFHPDNKPATVDISNKDCSLELTHSVFVQNSEVYRRNAPEVGLFNLDPRYPSNQGHL